MRVGASGCHGVQVRRVHLKSALAELGGVDTGVLPRSFYLT